MNRDPITINGKTWIYDASSRTHRPADQVAAKANDRSAVQSAELERIVGDGVAATHEGAAFDSQVRIRITSHRPKLWDCNNTSDKATVDALVHCGILRGDGPKEVETVHHMPQIKVQNKSEEKTVIEIEAIQ